MRLIVTGGGTGGHVFPALEIALAARRRGDEVLYLGSLRGQEGRACERARLDFAGFPTEPLYSLRSWRGWRAAVGILRATGAARRRVRAFRPDVVFSAGGYSSAPVVGAARGLGVPYVIHEQNSAPGRTNKMFSLQARCVATVFHAASKAFPGARVVRTGMPIRRELRDSAQGKLSFAQERPRPGEPLLLVMGGSQGAAALNDAALATAVRMAEKEVRWLHVTGPSHFESTINSMRRLGVLSRFQIKAYLEAEEMAAALFACDLAICRSGGSIAELAAFRKPSILVPLPTAIGDHQRLNALEFEAMGAAIILPQADLQPSTLEARILAWLYDEDRRAAAASALAEWDAPDAVDHILSLLTN